jgi:hypothetical protein
MWAESLEATEQNLAELEAENRQRLIEDWRGDRLFAPELDEAFVELASRRVAILHGDAGPSPPWTSELNPPPYPLTDIAASPLPAWANRSYCRGSAGTTRVRG